MAEDTEDLWSDDEWRAQMSSADINDLPDSAFAYIEDGGTKDDEGKTTPRSLRHFPIHDAAHVRNALARAPQSPFGDKAMPKIKAAAKTFGIKVDESKSQDTTITIEVKSSKEQLNAALDRAGLRRKKPRHRSGPSVGIEVRQFAAEGLEVRSASDGSDSIEISGSPVVYNSPYNVRDMFGEFSETMAPGVATALLPTADVRFLFNHEGLPLARTASGTLMLDDSATSLNFKAQLDSRQGLANDLAIAIGRGDVSQMSVGFIVADDAWNPAETERTIYRFADLLDVSAVTYPASPTTSISVAQRMMEQIPVESRARVRRMWAITRDLREGHADPEAIQTLAAGLSALAEVDDEQRDAPTDVDKKMPKALADAHSAVHSALQKQMTDPDNGSDPDDGSVTGHIKDALSSLVKAQVAQGIDGTPDAEDRDETSTHEEDPDASQDEPNVSPTSAQDGTGSRSDEIEAELRRRRISIRMQLEQGSRRSA